MIRAAQCDQNVILRVHARNQQKKKTGKGFIRSVFIERIKKTAQMDPFLVICFVNSLQIPLKSSSEHIESGSDYQNLIEKKDVCTLTQYGCPYRKARVCTYIYIYMCVCRLYNE
ncbi:hypothetical protein RHMOL_Rhmol08G0118700 [Rhododendron molle]|uniref:Uncharacterized protein n=1 Tax=Rhododendron molle TaxID=49168 RepID=A0ACC0MMA8_RHOML|nr:hypothetical protein RHMOL_Rhmol08G0118700 [Rhododendron molle]